MKRLFGSYRSRLLMAVVLLAAFTPNALFMEHWSGGVLEAAAHETPAEHAHHPGRQSANGAAEPAAAQQPTHCHVGPESCAASSGLSNAIVISAALALTLLGGGVLLLAMRSNHVFLFDLARRPTEPPRLNLRTV